MNAVDYLVMVGVLVAIAAYGMWRTRGQHDLKTYVKGGETHWLTIGLCLHLAGRANREHERR